MALKNKTLPGQGGDGAFMPHVESRPDSRPSRRAEERATTRPGKMVALHWLTVLCLVLAAGLILYRDQVDGRALRMWLLEGHRHFGLLVLLLFAVRVVIRIRLGKLPPHDGSSLAVRAMAALTHVAMYALLLGLPVIGWCLSDAEGKPVHFLGVTLPALVASDEDLADTLQTWHLNAAWVLLGLVSLHIVAALWHHFVLRDGVLRSMLPKRRR